MQNGCTQLVLLQILSMLMIMKLMLILMTSLKLGGRNDQKTGAKQRKCYLTLLLK